MKAEAIWKMLMLNGKTEKTYIPYSTRETHCDETPARFYAHAANNPTQGYFEFTKR